MPEESGHSRVRQIDRQKLLLAVAYMCAVTAHTVLVVMGLALLGGYSDFGYGLMALLAAAFLAPIVFSWIVIAVWLVRRARARLGIRSPIRRLVIRPVVIALVAAFLHDMYISVKFRGISHPPAERNAWKTDHQLDEVEQDLQRFHYKYGHLPKDLEELSDEWWEGWDPVRVYWDPFTGPGEASIEPLYYVRLDSTNALVYSLGPDLDDDKGQKEFTEDQLRFHRGSLEWRSIPFAGWLYERYDVSAELDGDITRRVSFRQRETQTSE